MNHRCCLGLHDLPDPEDAWEVGWPIGIGGAVKVCQRCGRAFRLALDKWIDIQDEEDAWDRERRKRVKREADARERVEAWEARQAKGGAK